MSLPISKLIKIAKFLFPNVKPAQKNPHNSTLLSQ